MNFRIEDCSTDTKFIAKVIFDDDVTSYFALDNYDVNILELTTGESRELMPVDDYPKDISFGDFGLRTGCPDFNLYMEENLFNNDGILYVTPIIIYIHYLIRALYYMFTSLLFLIEIKRKKNTGHRKDTVWRLELCSYKSRLYQSYKGLE